MHTKWWSVLFGAVLLAELIIVLVAPLMGWWLPRNVSTTGGGVDLLFYIILVVTGFFFVLTEGLLVYNLYRASVNPDIKPAYIHGNHKLELTWTIVPGAILLILAVAQINVWADIKYHSRMPKPDGDVLQVEVTARQWEWRMRYPGSKRMDEWAGLKAGTVSGDDKQRIESEMQSFKTRGFEDKGHIDDVHLVNELHVIKGMKTLVHLKTRDVLHSFFLPNLRLKQDALPGQTIPVWFEANDYNTERWGERWVAGHDPKSVKDKIDKYNDKVKDADAASKEAVDKARGDREEAKKLRQKANDLRAEADGILTGYDKDFNWELVCAEFCGTRHSLMRGKLFVHKDRDDYMAWLRSVEQADKPAGR